MAKKTTDDSPRCPVTLEQFKKNAKPLAVSINGIPMAAMVKAPFSTGSFGWYLNGKTVVEIDGQQVEIQIGCNLTAIGSKPK